LAASNRGAIGDQSIYLIVSEVSADDWNQRVNKGIRRQLDAHTPGPFG
jgi:hypothetical protein